MKKPSLTFLAPICCLTAYSVLSCISVFAQSAGNIVLTLVSPMPGMVVIAKKPKIAFRSSENMLDEGQLILLDGNDITALVTHEGNLYSFTPLSPLAAGEHTLYVVSYAEDGTSLEKEFVFSSRQSESFEEIYSDNRLSSTIKTVLKRSSSSSPATLSDQDTAVDTPYTTFDNYLTSDSAVKEGKWQSSAKANIRYYEQNAALQEPEKKGLSLIDFLISADYAGKTLTAHTELGDTTIEESKNTVDYLSHRGVQANFSIHNLTVSGFGVLGTETGYEIDGIGLGFNSNDHIMGTSARLDFFDKKMALKAIYVRGGETGDSVGTWSDTPSRKGDVTGIVWTSDFFDQLLTSEVEFDVANYDNNVEDEVKEVNDKAYRIQIGGLTELYDYDLSYSYTGPQYEVVGNQSIIKDWAGFDFGSGVNLTNQSLHLQLTYSWDNVEDEEIYARLYSFTGGLDYQYSGWERFPVSLNFEHNRQNSTDEPTVTEKTDIDTDTLTGSISYIEGVLAIELRSSYSEQNDKTINDLDTHLLSVSLAPSYTGTTFSIMPSRSFSSSEDKSTDIRTDTNTLTLDISSSFLHDTLIGDLGGTYDWSTADDDSVDMNTASTYARLSYHLLNMWHLEDSTVSLEFTSTRQEDNIFNTKTSDKILSMVFSSTLPYSL